jgi:hypothetical protein
VRLVTGRVLLEHDCAAQTASNRAAGSQRTGQHHDVRCDIALLDGNQSVGKIKSRQTPCRSIAHASGLFEGFRRAAKSVARAY